MDDIKVVSNTVPQRGDDPRETLLAWFSLVAQTLSIKEWDLILSLSNPDTMKVFSEEFWRCMVANFVRARTPASQEYGDHFTAALYLAFFKRQLGLVLEKNHTWLVDFSYSVLMRLGEQNRLMPLKDDPLLVTFTQLAQE